MMGSALLLFTGTHGKEALDLLKGQKGGDGGWEGTLRVSVPTHENALKWAPRQQQRKSTIKGLGDRFI